MPCSPGEPYYHGKILKPTLTDSHRQSQRERKMKFGDSERLICKKIDQKKFLCMKYEFFVTKSIEKYRLKKLIFSDIVSAEKNRFLAKSDRDRLGLQIPRSAVSVCESVMVSAVGLICAFSLPFQI